MLPPKPNFCKYSGQPLSAFCKFAFYINYKKHQFLMEKIVQWLLRSCNSSATQKILFWAAQQFSRTFGIIFELIKHIFIK